MSKKTKKLLFSLFLLAAVFTVGHFALALDFGLDQAAGTGLGLADPRIIAARVIRVAFGFLGILAVGLVIYAGWLWMSSNGHEEKVEKAKKILIGALIGVIICLSSFAIASYILNRLQEAASSDPGAGNL